MIKIRPKMDRYAAIGALLVVVAGAQAGPSKFQQPKVAARVGDKIITVPEVDAEFLSTNMKLAQQMYEARLKALEQLVLERAFSAEAASKNTTVDALINQKLAANAKPVTNSDVENYYNKNKQRMRGKTLEQVSSQIRSYLVSQGTTNARRVIMAQVKKDANVKILLEVPRAVVPVAANDPYTGSVGAKVTIVEFSDFQ